MIQIQKAWSTEQTYQFAKPSSSDENTPERELSSGFGTPSNDSLPEVWLRDWIFADRRASCDNTGGADAASADRDTSIKRAYRIAALDEKGK